MLAVNVNQLAHILSEYFGKDLAVEEVEIADAGNQHNPKRKKIGVGGVLTLFLAEEA
jgi:hypothetical protein